MKNYYLYVTYNLTNNKKYIGQHCTHNLYDDYYGSCKELKKDIINGDRYQVCILSFYDNIFDLGNAEFDYIKQMKAVKDDNYYNKSNTRYFNRHFEYGVKELTKKKMRDTIKLNGGHSGEKNPMCGKGYLIEGERNGSYGKGNSKSKHWKVTNRKPSLKVTCPKCGKVGSPNTMYRFHFDNCGISDLNFNKKMSDIAKRRWTKIKNQQ